MGTTIGQEGSQEQSPDPRKREKKIRTVRLGSVVRAGENQRARKCHSCQATALQIETIPVFVRVTGG
jgi:hypothetical protein